MRRNDFLIRSAALSGALAASAGGLAVAQVAPSAMNFQQGLVRVVQADAYRTLPDGSRSYSGRVVVELRGLVLEGSASSFVISPTGGFKFDLGPRSGTRVGNTVTPSRSLVVSRQPGVHISTITVK